MNELETLRAKLKAANERIGELDQQVSDLSDRQRSPYSMGLEHGRGSKASAAVAYGAAAERARIVAWIREQSNPHPENHNDDIDCGAALQQGTHEGWYCAQEDIAQGIESGAHLPSATEGE